MKNLIIESLDNFLSIVEEFPTPLKIYNVESVEVNKVKVEAICFLRTFMISFNQTIDNSELQGVKEKLEKNGFVKGRVEETKLELLES